jgi:hypothetical protein
MVYGRSNGILLMRRSKPIDQSQTPFSIVVSIPCSLSRHHDIGMIELYISVINGADILGKNITRGA